MDVSRIDGLRGFDMRSSFASNLHTELISPGRGQARIRRPRWPTRIGDVTGLVRSSASVPQRILIEQVVR